MDRAEVFQEVRTAGGWLLDFALPPRCPGCGEIMTAVDLFCAACRSTLDFISGGCECCGPPLAPGVTEVCLTCERGKSPLQRIQRRARLWRRTPLHNHAADLGAQDRAGADHGKPDEASAG